MTTNHRPTLESKRGKVEGIKDTIAHKRNLPQQTTLKLRKDTKYNVSTADIDDLKYELLKQEGRLDDVESGSDDDGRKRNLIDSTESSKRRKVEEDDLDDEEDDDDSAVDEEDYSESDDEDETAQLLQELNKIKQERKSQQQKLEYEKTVESAKTSNPLVLLDSTPPAKTSWRKSTAFNQRESVPEKQEPRYVQNSLKSEYHQKFLSKHIR